MICNLCEQNKPVFDLKCNGCKDRLVMMEDCKIRREQVAKHIDKKYGVLTDYKREPHCGCTTKCKQIAIKNEFIQKQKVTRKR